MSNKLSNLQQRVISALLLLPVVCIPVYLGGFWFFLAATIALGIGVWEFNHIYLQNPVNYTSTAVMVLMVVLMCIVRYYFGFDWSWRLFAVCFMLIMVYSTVSYEKGNDHAANGFATAVTGLVYFGWIGSYAIALRGLDDGLIWVIFTFVMTWSADIGAFFVGRIFGKTHMFKRVSPKKTWEGYFGGVIFTVLIAYLAHSFVPQVRSLMIMKEVLLFGFTISVVCPFGDFGESMLKRSFNVKDSSNLIPGHGGVLDRLDSILFSMPIAFWFFEIVNSQILRS